MDSVISLSEIIDFVGNFSRPLKEGSLLAQSKHFIHFGLCSSSTASVHRFIGFCLTSTLSAAPHKVEVTKEVEDGIISLSGKCSCKAGTGRCKHVVGFMLILEKLPSSDVEHLSKTDLTQQWGKLSSKKLEAYQACRLSQLCHVHEKKVPYQSVSSEITGELGSSIFTNILQAFPDSVTALSINSEAVNCTLDGQHIDPSDSRKHDLDSSVREFIDSAWFLEDDEQTLMELNARSQEEIRFFYSFVHVDAADSFELYKKTKFENVEWKAQRQVRITGTTSYQLYTYMKGKQLDWDHKLRSVIFPKFAGNANTKYGRNSEKKAVRVLQKRYSSNQSTFTDEVGFIVNIRAPWLGFSPDGFITAGTQVILAEIKSPVKGKTMFGTELCQHLSYLNEVSPHEFVLKQKHPYYAQIQLGLMICNLPLAKLIIYSSCNGDVVEINVPFDSVFALDMFQTLRSVYFNLFLPFLACNIHKLISLTSRAG